MTITTPPAGLPLASVSVLALGTALAFGAGVSAARAQGFSLPQTGLTSYGMPGMIDMPTATALPDGTLAATLFAMRSTRRATFAFQGLPRLTFSFRYAAMSHAGYRDNEGLGRETLHDRSFDLHWLVVEEGRYMPAIAVGLRDFIGTGAYSSEYVVASRSFGPRLRASLGLGWGRLASHGGFTNPLGVISERFETRPGGFTGTGGRFETNRFFRGDAAFFGGVQYQASERLTLMAEYSSDAYVEEAHVLRPRNPVNLGFAYRLGQSSTVSGYLVHGSTIGLSASFTLTPSQPLNGGIRAGSPTPVSQRVAAGPGGYSTDWTQREGLGARLGSAVGTAFSSEGLRLEAMELRPTSATIRFTNNRHEVLPRAIGRAARILTHALPASVEQITLVPMADGVPGTAVTISRSQLERLEHDPAGAERLLASTRFADPMGAPGLGRFWSPHTGSRPRFSWGVSPYFSTAYFDPDSPVRIDVGLRATLRYDFAENFSANLTISQLIAGNVGEGRDPSLGATPGYPQVRTNSISYNSDSPVVSRMTLDYTAHPLQDVYGRLTVGWLERMYAGVSAELLWSPVDSRLALGAELNHVAQRDPDSLLGVNDLRITTGHLSAYYDFGSGYLGQLDVGRYLAGDTGATLTFTRQFANGVSVGAWATLTDMPFDTFGEGSFDKGISISIPVATLLGTPSRNTISTSLRSLTRDGGARLSVPGQLYPTLSEMRATNLRRSWGAAFQ